MVIKDLQEKLKYIAEIKHIKCTPKAILALQAFKNTDLRNICKSDSFNSYITGKAKSPLDPEIRAQIAQALSEVLNLTSQEVCSLSIEEIRTIYNHRQRKIGADLLHTMHIDMREYDLTPKPKPLNHAQYGQENQKYMYFNQAGVMIWKELIELCDDYKMYEHCQRLLQNFLRNNIWKNMAGSISHIYILGAGSPKKDQEVIKSLQAHEMDNISYILVDTSMHMLAYTAKEISCLQGKLPVITSIMTDFQNMDRMIKIVQDRLLEQVYAIKKRSIYFMLGATLSNINENEFFASLNQVFKSGDLFVATLEFIENHDKDGMQMKKKLLNTYNNPFTKKLAKNALSGIEYLNWNIPYDTITCTSHPFKDPYNYFEDSLEVCLSLDQLQIFRATRHRRDVYIKFVEKFGFKEICPEELRVVNNEIPLSLLILTK